MSKRLAALAAALCLCGLLLPFLPGGRAAHAAATEGAECLASKADIEAVREQQARDGESPDAFALCPSPHPEADPQCAEDSVYVIFGPDGETVKREIVSYVCHVPPSPACARGELLSGTSGGDLLHGTTAGECLQGGEGADALDGKGGDDEVDGGSGSDRVVGGAGRDELLGGTEGDLLSDGLGKNHFRGGTGADVVFATQSIAERVDCGPGDDTAFVDRKDTTTGCEHAVLPGQRAIGQAPSGSRPRRASVAYDSIANGATEYAHETIDRYEARTQIAGYLRSAEEVGDYCQVSELTTEMFKDLLSKYRAAIVDEPETWPLSIAGFVGGKIGAAFSGTTDACEIEEQDIELAHALDGEIHDYFHRFPRPPERRYFHSFAITNRYKWTYRKRGLLRPDLCDWQTWSVGWGRTRGYSEIKYYADGSCP